MNRTFDTLPYLALICLSLAVLSGCKKVDVPSDDLSQGLVPSGTPITFTADAAFTKAPINGIKDLEVEGNKFLVWGWFQGSTSGYMFDGTEVKYGQLSGWTYDEPRYWMSGTYDFFAIYPSSIATDVQHTSSGYTFNYTLPQTAEEQKDLLAAYVSRIDGNYPPESVELTFNHLLCQLSFEAKSASEDNLKAILYGIDIEASASATYSSSAAWTGYSDYGKVYSVKGNDKLNSVEYTTLETGIMMMPQDFTKVKLTIRYYGADLTAKSTVVTLQSFVDQDGKTVTHWEPGKQYKYRLSIEANEAIAFATPIVTPWNNVSGGSFIINTPIN